MIKFIITAVIIYFVVRSIANKPWLDKQSKILRSKRPDSPAQRQQTPEDEDYTEYEELD